MIIYENVVVMAEQKPEKKEIVPRPEEYFQQFNGADIDPSIFRIKGKDMSEYAKAIGETDPKYIAEPPKTEGEKADYSKIEAHPAFAATYTVPAMLKAIDLKGKDGAPMVLNVGKLLHTGQDYDFTGCDALKDGEKVYTKAKLEKLTIKSDILWIPVRMICQNKEGTKTFCKALITVGIRKGGY